MQLHDYYIVMFIFIYGLYIRLQMTNLRMARSSKFYAIILVCASLYPSVLIVFFCLCSSALYMFVNVTSLLLGRMIEN